LQSTWLDGSTLLAPSQITIPHARQSIEERPEAGARTRSFSVPAAFHQWNRPAAQAATSQTRYTYAVVTVLSRSSFCCAVPRGAAGRDRLGLHRILASWDPVREPAQGMASAGLPFTRPSKGRGTYLPLAAMRCPVKASRTCVLRASESSSLSSPENSGSSLIIYQVASVIKMTHVFKLFSAKTCLKI